MGAAHDYNPVLVSESGLHGIALLPVDRHGAMLHNATGFAALNSDPDRSLPIRTDGAQAAIRLTWSTQAPSKLLAIYGASNFTDNLEHWRGLGRILAARDITAPRTPPRSLDVLAGLSLDLFAADLRAMHGPDSALDKVRIGAGRIGLRATPGAPHLRRPPHVSANARWL